MTAEMDQSMADLDSLVPSLTPDPAAFQPRAFPTPADAASVVCGAFPCARSVLPLVSHPHPSLRPVSSPRHKILFGAVSDQCGLGTRKQRTHRRDKQGIKEPETVCQWPMEKLFPNHGAGNASDAETAAPTAIRQMRLDCGRHDRRLRSRRGLVLEAVLL